MREWIHSRTVWLDSQLRRFVIYLGTVATTGIHLCRGAHRVTSSVQIDKGFRYILAVMLLIAQFGCGRKGDGADISLLHGALVIPKERTGYQQEPKPEEKRSPFG
jgi:hypothetical protein